MRRLVRAAAIATACALLVTGLASCSNRDGECDGKRMLIVNHGFAKPGQEIVVSGSGYLEGCTSGAPLTDLELTLKGYDRYTLATVQPDAQGEINLTVKIPKDVKIGHYDMRLSDVKVKFEVR